MEKELRRLRSSLLLLSLLLQLFLHFYALMWRREYCPHHALRQGFISIWPLDTRGLRTVTRSEGCSKVTYTLRGVVRHFAAISGVARMGPVTHAWSGTDCALKCWGPGNGDRTPETQFRAAPSRGQFIACACPMLWFDSTGGARTPGAGLTPDDAAPTVGRNILRGRQGTCASFPGCPGPALPGKPAPLLLLWSDRSRSPSHKLKSLFDSSNYKLMSQK